MPLELAIGIAAILIAIAALAVALGQRSAQGRARREAEAEAAASAETQAHRPQLAVIINPSKEGSAEVEAAVRRVCSEAALPDPLFLETTVEDPGTGQARQALEAGVDVVVAAGGDGTVRAVAEALVGTGRSMGLIPVGTGNLLARNLDIPLTSTEEALAVVLGGGDRPIDVGWARITDYGEGDRASDAYDEAHPPLPRPSERGGPPVDAAGDPEVEGAAHIFLVIAGLGFDAAMVADTDDQLKAKVGWAAYFVSGVRHLHGRRMRAQIQLDDKPAVDARLRSVMVGNCGRLPGGITLLPDAVIDDGELDVAAVDTRGGLAGWAQLLGEVVIQGFGVRNDLPGKIGRIDHARARRVRVRVAGGEQAQVDGDPLGRAVELEMWVQPRALVIRAP
jgi:diacylglycerol kinase (ATP)